MGGVINRLPTEDLEITLVCVGQGVKISCSVEFTTPPSPICAAGAHRPERKPNCGDRFPPAVLLGDRHRQPQLFPAIFPSGTGSVYGVGAGQSPVASRKLTIICPVNSWRQRIAMLNTVNNSFVFNVCRPLWHDRKDPQ